MKLNGLLALVVAAGGCTAASAQVLISEVVDGPLSGGNPKFVELFNASATQSVTLGAGKKLKSYNNGGLTGTTVLDFATVEITLLPGQTYTIAASANSGQSVWTTVYGPFNQPDLFLAGGVFLGNGNDVYTLEEFDGVSDVIVDIYGRIGQAAGSSDFSMDWAYADSYARRAPNVCAPNAVFDINEWIIPGNDALEVGASNDTGGVWTQNTRDLTNPNTHANICALGNDCNGNGIPDSTDIATGTSQDCNNNGIPDECDIAIGASNDCNGNGVPDECDIASGNVADCNGNGIPDSCELSGNDCNGNGVLDACDIASGTSQDVNNNGIPDECEPFLFDCNNNGIEDAIDIANGTSQDCNSNGIPDECELADGLLTDADGNGIPDACEGAFVGEAFENATVQPDPFGVRNAPNGLAFFNVQGANGGTFASYGGLRFDIGEIKTFLDNEYGVDNYTIDRVYLHLTQSNAAFTANGGVEVFSTDNDSQDFSPNASPEVTFYGNFETDFADRLSVTTYTFTQVANGHNDAYLMYDANGSNTPGGDAIVSKLGGGFGPLTLLLRETDPAVVATYAGITNNAYRGPTIVVFATEGGGTGCPACAADFNEDGGVDGQDVEAFFTVWESGEGCGDVNEDGGVDGGDIEFFFTLWEQGGC
jgi:hypothetical protein